MYDSAHVRRLISQLDKDRKEIEMLREHIRGDMKKQVLAQVERRISETIREMVKAAY